MNQSTLTKFEQDAIDAAYDKDYRQWHRQRLRTAFFTLLRRHRYTGLRTGALQPSGWAPEFAAQPWHCIAFYWLKAVLCFLLGRTKGSHIHANEVTYFNNRDAWSMDCSNATEWDAVWVGEGVFTRWYVTIVSDSSC